MRKLAAEPLVQFALLGALVFAGHRWVTRAITAPTLEVTAAKQRELAQLFEQRLLRAPSHAERTELVQRYLEDEALFREGLRLDLVRSDPLLRTQIIAQVRGLLQREIGSEPPTDVALQIYYNEHAQDYAVPETLSLREYLVRSGPDATDASRELLRVLQRQAAQASAPNTPPAQAIDTRQLPIPTDHTGQSLEQLRRLYGPELAPKLWALPAGKWHALRDSLGVHVVRVDQRAAAHQPNFASIRPRLTADYQRAETARAFKAALSRLTSQWRVQLQPAESP